MEESSSEAEGQHFAAEDLTWYGTYVEADPEMKEGDEGRGEIRRILQRWADDCVSRIPGVLARTEFWEEWPTDEDRGRMGVKIGMANAEGG